ncbi:hypothetical protein PT2222_270036 [Paraburkholderia tropica]
MPAAPLSGKRHYNKRGSVERCGAQIRHLLRRDRRALVPPRHADEGHDRRHFLVGQRLGERRHAVRARIALRAGRIAAVEHHPDRIHRRFHLDRLVVRERREVRRHAEAVLRMALRTLVMVDLLTLLQEFAAERFGGFHLHGLGRFLALRDGLQIGRHRLDVVVGDVLQAVVDHVRHRPEHGAALRDAGFQQTGDVLDLPVAETAFARRERGRVPVLQRNQPARERRRIDRRAHHVDRRVAHAAVAESFDQIRAAIPFDRFGRIGLVFALAEEQRAPADQQVAVVEREFQLMRTARHVYRRHRAQIGVDRIRIRARDLGVAREREGRVEQAAVFRAARVHGAVEVVAAPLADAVLVVGRDVRRVERAEGRGHRQAAREGLAAAHRVTGDAVAGAGQILALLDQLGLVGGRGRLRRSAVQIGVAGPQHGYQRRDGGEHDCGQSEQGLAVHRAVSRRLIAVRCRMRAASSTSQPRPARDFAARSAWQARPRRRSRRRR